MAVPILVVTPNVGFGELICQILTETGDYAMMLATDRKEALKTAKVEKPALMILETALNGTPVSELVEVVRKGLPELLLVLIVPEFDSEEVAFSAMEPDGVLKKPVYLPDLMNKVDEIIKNCGLDDIDRAKTRPRVITGPVDVQEEEELPPPPEWLNDVNLAAQHLTRLSLESAAQASLITKGDQIYAYAGELPQLAAEELARTVASHFVNGGGSDLARFIRLEETSGEYMLYATGLGGEYVLATVFDAEMPFSKIRAQASDLAVALSSPPAKTPVEDALLTPTESDEDLEEEDLMEIGPILEDVPPPIPESWTPESSLPKKPESLLEELLGETQEDSFSSETVAVARPAPDTKRKDQPEPDPNQELKKQIGVDTEEEDQPEAVVQPDELPSEELKPVSTPEHEAETIASRSRHEQTLSDETQVSRSAQRPKQQGPEVDPGEIDVEPVSPSMYNLTYACVLIPRFPHHHLTGEIAKRLSDWITHLCVAFGWRLEHLSVRPGYVQWLVNVPPNTSPGYLMRTIRQHTSRRMFVEFPVTETENLSGDFWAPGYLILGNPQPPPPSLVLEFIQNTRSRQGIEEQKRT